MKKILFLLCTLLMCANVEAQNNLDLESTAPGTYTSIPNWTIAQTVYSLNATGYCFNYTPVATATALVRQTPTVTGVSEPTLIPASPLGGNNVLMLNSVMAFSTGLIRASHAYTVTPANKYLTYAYFAWVVPGDHLSCCNHHYFQIDVVDCVQAPVLCSSVAVTATSNVCPNTGTLGMVQGTTNVYTPNWITKTIDLSMYVGSCITIRVEVGNCVYLGHNQILFFDAIARPSLISMNAPCNGNTATLTSVAANSYTWSGPGGFTNNGQSIVTSTAGVYTLTTGNYQCGTPTQTYNLVFPVTPTVNLSSNTPTICSGSSATLTASGNGINTYSWNTGATTSSIVVSPTVNTTYTFTANSGTCGVVSTISLGVVICNSLAEHNLNSNAFDAYPNPGRGNIFIKSERNENMSLKNELGQLITEFKLTKENQFKYQLKDLSAGIYFLSNGSYTKRIVVLE